VVENSQTYKMVSQLVKSKQETLDNNLEEIVKDIGTQILETKYIEHVSLEPIVVWVVIDHHMVIIHVQVGRNFTDYVLLMVV